MGADSAGVSGLNLTVRADRKMFVRDGYIFGFTSSFRMGQLLQHKLQIPKRHLNADAFEFMCNDFIDAVRRTFSDGGFRKLDNGVESGGNFLVGHAGRIFEIYTDFQVCESIAPYAACGCGFDLALGSLHTSARASTMSAPERVMAALEAAQAYSAGVRAPFHLESVGAA